MVYNAYIAERLWGYLSCNAPVLVFLLDVNQRIMEASREASRRLGGDLIGKAFSDLLVHFTQETPVPLKMTIGAPVKLNLKTASGTPETFDFYFFEITDGILAMGSLDLIEQELIQHEILGLNRDLNDMTRQVHLANAELQKKNEELQQALAQVKMLKGLLPICATCKKIRDAQGEWHHLETYVQAHSEAHFSHGFCPDCFNRYLNQIEQIPVADSEAELRKNMIQPQPSARS